MFSGLSNSCADLYGCVPLSCLCVTSNNIYRVLFARVVRYFMPLADPGSIYSGPSFVYRRKLKGVVTFAFFNAALSLHPMLFVW